MSEAVPLLVLSSGQRCGGTLVQRLLSSHPEVLVWGEHEGQLAPLLDVVRTLEAREHAAAAVPRAAYEQLGHQAFMANLMPDRGAIAGAARAFATTLFAEPAAARGRPRWGVKETVYRHEEAEALRALFPGLRAIHVTRDPRDVLVSLDHWEREADWTRDATERALRDWVAVNESFIDPPPWVSSHRYEDIVARSEEFTRALAGFAGLDHERCDREVFRVRAHGSGANGHGPRELRAYGELPAGMRRLLDDERLREVAAAYGYRLGEA